MQTERIEDDDDRRARERLCAATRLVRPVGTLIRLVAAPDGTLTPDLKRALPGRGVWVTANRASVQEAMRKRAFPRLLKRPVEVPAELPDLIERLLQKSALDMLSFANKAGLVLAGFAKVMDAIDSERVSQRLVALIQARDGAEDGARKLAQAVKRAYWDKNAPNFITIFDSAHLDLALGRTNVIHAALCAGPAVTGFLDRVAALAFWQDGGLASAEPHPSSEAPLQADDEPSTQDAAPSQDGDDVS